LCGQAAKETYTQDLQKRPTQQTTKREFRKRITYKGITLLCGQAAKRDLHTRRTKETDEREMPKKITYKTYKRDLHTKEMNKKKRERKTCKIYERDLHIKCTKERHEKEIRSKPMKETYTQDLQQKRTKEKDVQVHRARARSVFLFGVCLVRNSQKVSSMVIARSKCTSKLGFQN
jgi:hypothetical protein